jgi:hypothetical protein
LTVPETTANGMSKEGAIRMNGIGLRGRYREGIGNRARVAGAVLVLALLAGCAALPGGSPDEARRKAVAERAAARWALIIRGDAGAAYDEYMSKGSRAVISRGEFVAKMRVTAFRTAAVEKVECAVESCKAVVEITYDHKLMKGVSNTMGETWIIEDGQPRFVWLL